MAEHAKDTIYVDVDDEITTIIDKVRSSEGKIVALVLPKRATVFQSIVNMKLLKRSAESAKKHLVLITSEASLMPLAGAVGLHVAETPQSKPEVPAAGGAQTDDEVVEADGDAEYTATNAGDRPIGELAGAHAAPEAIETLSLPDAEDEGPDDAGAGKKSSSKSAKDKHLKVPNFNKFRLRLALGVLALVVVVVGLYVCLTVLPKATIAIATNSSDLNATLTPTLDPAAQTLDVAKAVLPAKIEQQQKTTSQQVATTGQKNTGTAAAGSVTMSACIASFSSFPDSVPAGTGITTNGLTFITQDITKFSHTGTPNGSCFAYQATSATAVAAQNPGTKYNVSSATFSVAGRSDVTGTGSTSGGTDSIIQIIAQADIDSAKQKLATQDTNAVKSSLTQALNQDGFYPIQATFNASTPTVTTSGNVGDQATNVTVTQAVTYTMYGVKKNDLEALIKNNINNQITASSQGILDDGLAKATINVANTSGNTVQITLQTTATVGPNLNVADIKKQAGGKKIGDVKAMLNDRPGVTSVDVHLSPFWVSTVPTNPTKVTVTIGKAAQSNHGNGQ